MALTHNEPHLDHDDRCTCDRPCCVDPATDACVCRNCTCPEAQTRRTRVAAYREAAELIANHPGPHTDEHHADAGGFWWDTRDRDAIVTLLRQRADEIHGTTNPTPDGARSC
jgi:hypothetical protein